MASFQNATWIQCQNEVALRLNDPSFVHWTQAEIKLYLAEAIRVWNCLTQEYIVDWTATFTQPDPPAAQLPIWFSTANGLNPLVGDNPTSPRYQTLTDSNVYTVAQYHLLEPPTGNGTWTGTSMFSLQDFVNAFMRRRDQILQATACNVGPFTPISVTPGTNRVQLPDSPSQSILDMRRIRFVPTSGNPATLYRDDTMSFEYFNNGYEQEMGTPLSWDVLGSPQQFITFDAKPNVPNILDMLGILSGGTVTPPTAAPLLIPDDFYWVLKFGIMADLLSKETESKDLMRAQYCQQRFDEGVQLMKEMPWLLQAFIDNVPVDTPSFFEADEFDYEWQSNGSAIPQIIRGGIDLFAISPIPGSPIQYGYGTNPGGYGGDGYGGGDATNPVSVGVTLSLVANAPIPTSDGGFVQVSRDVLDVIFDEAEHLAQLKEGGQEMAESMVLHQRFIQAAMETNRRLKESGIFSTDLRRTISKEDQAEPRFALAGKES